MVLCLTDYLVFDLRLWHSSKGPFPDFEGSAVLPDGVPTLDEIRRRVIRELVDADIQSAGRRRRGRRHRAARATLSAVAHPLEIGRRGARLVAQAAARRP